MLKKGELEKHNRSMQDLSGFRPFTPEKPRKALTFYYKVEDKNKKNPRPTVRLHNALVKAIQAMRPKVSPSRHPSHAVLTSEESAVCLALVYGACELNGEPMNPLMLGDDASCPLLAKAMYAANFKEGIYEVSVDSLRGLDIPDKKAGMAFGFVVTHRCRALSQAVSIPPTPIERGVDGIPEAPPKHSW